MGFQWLGWWALQTAANPPNLTQEERTQVQRWSLATENLGVALGGAGTEAPDMFREPRRPIPSTWEWQCLKQATCALWGCSCAPVNRETWLPWGRERPGEMLLAMVARAVTARDQRDSRGPLVRAGCRHDRRTLRTQKVSCQFSRNPESCCLKELSPQNSLWEMENVFFEHKIQIFGKACFKQTTIRSWLTWAHNRAALAQYWTHYVLLAAISRCISQVFRFAHPHLSNFMI